MVSMTSVFFISKFDYNDLFDYLSNWTFNQLEQKKLPWSKWPMGSSQVGHLIKLDKANHMFGQNDKWFSNPIQHPMLFNRPN